MFFVFFILIIMLLLLLLTYYVENLDYFRKGNKLPAIPSHFIFGHSWLILLKPHEAFKLGGELADKFKGIMAFWAGPFLNVFIYDPKDAEIILRGSREMGKSYHYSFLKSWLGDSILLGSGEQFRRNKKIMVASFHVNNLKDYIPIFNQQGHALVESLKGQVNKGEFDVLNHLRLSAMHTLLETVLGVDDNTMTSEDVMDFSKSTERLGRYFGIRFYKLHLYSDLIFRFSNMKKKQDASSKIVHQLADSVIKKRKIEYEKRKKDGTQDTEYVNKARNKFLDNFFEARKENGEEIDPEEIRNEVLTMMLAGQDTSTVSIGFVLSLLGMYQPIQDKVVAELDEILGNSDRDITFEDVQNMKYLDQVIQETWRLYPPIPVIGRTLKEDLQLENYVIPKGANVTVGIYLLHRNQSIYENPHQFNPDNFLPEKIKARHPYSYIPFSANYRACIGSRYAVLVVKIFLALILKKYKVTSTRHMKDFILSGGIVQTREEGFLISLQHRNKDNS